MNTLLSKKQLANHLGVSEQTVDRWRKAGMPWTRTGVKLVRFELEAVNAWTEQRQEMKFVLANQQRNAN